MGRKRILIVEEKNFSTIGAAQLGLLGIEADCHDPCDNCLDFKRLDDYLAVVTNPAVGRGIIQRAAAQRIPLILLTEGITADFISEVADLGRVYCLVKPIDYRKLMQFVHDLAVGRNEYVEGWHIVS